MKVISDLPLDLQPYKSVDDETLSRRIEAVRKELGSELLILGHHYQQDARHRSRRPAG